MDTSVRKEWPQMEAWPEVGLYSPVYMEIVVVFPAPARRRRAKSIRVNGHKKRGLLSDTQLTISDASCRHGLVRNEQLQHSYGP